MPLKSLAEIRGQDNSPSSGGLKSLSDIRMQQQQQSLMQDYPQMVADEQNYGYSDSQPAQENAQYADLMKQAYQNNPQSFQNPTQSPSDNQSQGDPSRNIPIIGPILRGLDAFATNPVVDKVANIARDFYVPGAGAANIAGLADAAESGISRLLPGLADSAAGRVAQKAASEAVVGAPIGAGQSLMTNPDESPTDLLQNAGLGGAMGAGFGVAGKAVGAGLSALADKYAGTKLGDALSKLVGTDTAPVTDNEPHLALPPGRRSSFDEASQRSEGTVLPTNNEPIANPYTFALDEANPETISKQNNVQDAFNAMSEIDNELKSMDSRNQQAVNDQYQLLKQQRNNRGGVQQGSLITDEAGNVTGRVGRVSDNPQWYQDFYAENGRVPTNKDLYQLAQNHVNEGYMDNGVQIPSWYEQTGYHENKAALQQVRDNLSQYIKDNGLGLTDAKLKENVVGVQRPQQATIAKQSEMPITASESTKPTMTSGRLQSLSEVKSGAQEPRLQSPSEIKATKQQEELTAAVKPEPRLRDKIVQFMDQKAAEAQARIDARRKIGFLPAQGNDFVDHAIIGAAHIVRNGVTYADYSEFMIKQFGNEIRQHLPQIYQKSVNLAKKDAKLTQKDLDRARNMTQFERNNYDTHIPDTKSHLTTKTKADKVPVADRARQAYIKNVDDVHRMSNFDKYASDVLGRDLRATEKTHTLALNSRSSDMISNHILTHDLVDAQGNHIGESFKDIVKQIPKGKQGEFEDYLINKHAITRMQRGEKVFPDKMKMSPEKSMQIVADYEKKSPQFKEIAQQYYDFNRKLGQAWLVDTGMIPQEVFDAWGKENPFYTPMQRKFSDLEKAKSFNSKSGGYGNQPKTVKEYSHVGSERPIISPIESTIEQIDRYVKTAKRNEVMQALIKNVAANPEDFKGWAEIVSKEKMDLKQLLDQEGIDGVLNQIDEPLQRAQIKNDLTKSNIVNGMLNGEKVHLQVNDAQLLDSLSNLHPSAQNFVIATLGKVTRVMKTLTTGFNPLFSLTRNIFRDIPDAYRYSTTTHNPVKFATDLVHAIFSELTHGKLAEEYRAMGGGHSGNISASRNMLSQSKNKILQANTVGQKVMKGVRGGFHKIENFNSAFEQGPRLAEFKRSVKQGGGDYSAKVQGLFNANDITVNFNRRGQISKDIDAIVPYYNASVQGLDKYIRSFNPKDPKQMTAGILKAVAAVTIPQMALWEINKDDPNYKKLSNYTKDNYFCIPKGDGTFFKIPKPREIGFVFGTLVERSMRKMEQNDPQAFKDIGTTLKNVFAPPGIAGMIDTQNGTISPTGALGETIVGPGVDLLQNKDFAGRPIVPKDLQSLSPQLQYDTKTSDIAKSLGNILGKSPKEIDYIIKSYGGVIGQVGIPAATSGNGGNPLSRIGNAINQNVTADPVYSNDISSNFYNAKGQYDQDKADAKSQGKVSNTVGIDTMLNRMSTTVSQLRKQMNTIQNNTNLPDDQKQAKLKAMQIQMNNIQQQALDSLQKYQQKAK